MDKMRFAVIVMVGLIAVVAGLFAEPVLQKCRDWMNKTSVGGSATGDEDDEGPYIPFGPTVVNLNEETLTYTLSLDITLETEQEYKVMMKRILKRKQPVLKTWLVEYLADKTPEDLRGASGVRRLRGDILDKFRKIMFAESELSQDRAKLKAIHFDEYHIFH